MERNANREETTYVRMMKIPCAYVRMRKSHSIRTQRTIVGEENQIKGINNNNYGLTTIHK